MAPRSWNEDLVTALNARHQQAWQQQSHHSTNGETGAKTIQAVRKDIRLTSTGKIYNLPTQNNKNFTKTVYEECVRIIKEETHTPTQHTPMPLTTSKQPQTNFQNFFIASKLSSPPLRLMSPPFPSHTPPPCQPSFATSPKPAHFTTPSNTSS